MTARHSDHRVIDGVLAEAPLVDAIGPVPELPYALKQRAANVVASYVPREDLRGLLEMLFAAQHPARQRCGNTPEDRTAWLQRCRAWFEEQNQPLAGTWVPIGHQRRYSEATGDYWRRDV